MVNKHQQQQLQLVAVGQCSVSVVLAWPTWPVGLLFLAPLELGGFVGNQTSPKMEFEENSLWGSLSRVGWYFFCDSVLVGSTVIGVLVLNRLFDHVRRKCGFSSR